MFADVLPCLRRWSGEEGGEQGRCVDGNSKTLAIFSSGSVAAQLQFLGHVYSLPSSPSSSTSTSSSSSQPTSNITSLFANRNFDTLNAGPKKEAQSYSSITQALQRRPGECVFFSDVVGEVRAAIEAGLRTVLVVREGNGPVEEAEKVGLDVVERLDQVVFGD